MSFNKSLLLLFFNSPVADPKPSRPDSKLARDSFKTFIPISVESDARQHIIFYFFDLLAAIAAHGKNNGFGGRKLSRMAAWWAFEQKDTGDGFDGGYKAWKKAADATTHLFFAYLRSLSPEQELTGISLLPMSLQKLLGETEYPPKPSDFLVSRTNKLVMIVDNVSPTPFALLRRASHFQYRDTDVALRKISEFDDVTDALTEECRRVLKSISSANQSQVSSSKHSTGLRDASWSRFEDIGFSNTLDEEDEYDNSALSPKPLPQSQSLVHLQLPGAQPIRTSPSSVVEDYARPTTPSWADFLSTGFVDDTAGNSNMLLPPDKVLPPIDTQPRQNNSSQSHHPRLESDRELEPGELASITSFELDDAFWWVWMNSLAPEETSDRKAAFGRCAVIETTISDGRWLVMEEIIAGAAPEPQEGAYIAEKKGLFSWTKRTMTISRRKSTKKPKPTLQRGQYTAGGGSTTSISSEAQAKIHAKAAQLRAIKETEPEETSAATHRGRNDAEVLDDNKRNSIFNLQPHIAGEASSAMKWVKKYDKGAVKDAYLSNDNAGRGTSLTPSTSQQTNGHASSGDAVAAAKAAAASASASSKSRRELSPKEKTPSPPAPQREAEEEQSVQQKDETLVKPQEEESKKLPEKPKEATEEKEREEGNTVPSPTPVTDEKQTQPAEEAAPAPPPKDTDTSAPEIEAAPAPVAAAVPTPASPANDGKKSVKEGKGFRKLFNKKKNRASKLPPGASGDLKKMAQEEPQATEQQDETTEQAPVHGESTEKPSTAEQVEPTLDSDNLGAETPVAAPEKAVAEDAQEDTKGTSDTAETTEEAAAAFETKEDDANDAALAANGRKSKHDEAEGDEADKNGLTKSASPGVQDRWAQIRKNAANRAATRHVEERDRSLPRKSGEGEEDTSGEESKSNVTEL